MELEKDEILYFLNAKQKGDGKWMAKCPCHDDRTESLFIGERDDGDGLIFYCHAGCSSKSIKEILPINKYYIVKRPRKMQLTEERIATSGKIEATYTYTDEDGHELFRKVRLEGKRFYIQHKKDNSWEPGMGKTRKVLYRLPEIIESKNQGNPIFFVEGEKDAETVRQTLNLAATTLFTGANSVMAPDVIKPLQGANLVLCGDNDEPGRMYIRNAVETIGQIVKRLSLVKIPEKFKDITDWIENGATMEDLRKAVSPIANKGIRPYSVYELFAMNLPPREKIMGDWLVQASPMMLAGQSGSGKSFFLHLMAWCISTGSTCLDWPCNQNHVTILDGEMSINTIQDRLMKISRALPFQQGVIPKLDIICKENFYALNKSMPDLRDPIQRTALLNTVEGTKVLIVDNVNIFFPGKDENSTEFWMSVEHFCFECIKRKLTPILVHHTPKVKTDAPAGSSKNERVAEVVMILSKNDREDENVGIYSNVKFRKTRDFSRDIKSFAFKVREFQGLTYFEKDEYVER